jgi:hypothetical protein
LNDFQRSHLLAYARGAVPIRPFGPAEAAHAAVSAAAALQGCGFGGGLQVGHDGVVGVGGGFGGCGKPAGKEGFFAKHVDSAVDEGCFAGDFEGDIVGEEGIKGLVQDAI